MAVDHIIVSLDSATPRWWHPQHGSGEGDLSAMPAQGRHSLCVLVPGAKVLLTKVKLPTGSRQRLRQALAFALEDQLVRDVDHYHFALGPKLRSADQGQHYLAAAVDLDTMDSWMQMLKNAGLKPDAMLPAPLALPAPASESHACVWVDESRALVRVGSQLGFECSLSELDLLLSLQPELKGLQVADRHSRWPDHGAVARQSLSFGQWPDDWAVAPTKVPLNLLQGQWQGRGDVAEKIGGVWRWAAVAALVAGSAALTQRYLEVAELKQQAASLDAVARQVVAQVVPQMAPGSSYRSALNDALSRLQGPAGKGQEGFFYLLEIIGPALVEGAGTELSSINFRSDGMVLDLTASSMNQVETLRRQISEQAPVPVVIESSETVVGGSRVRLRIGGQSRG